MYVIVIDVPFAAVQLVGEFPDLESAQRWGTANLQEVYPAYWKPVLVTPPEKYAS